MTNPLYIVQGGEEAIDFIFHHGKYAQTKPPTPDLIFFDINMPRMDGLQVLEILKANPTYQIIPVIMLAVSNRDEDIVKSFNGCSPLNNKQCYALSLTLSKCYNYLVTFSFVTTMISVVR